MKREENKKENENKGRHEHPLPSEINDKQKKQSESAFEEASKDIDEDPDLSIHSPNDDLDEGETARLGENTDLI